VIYSYVLKKRKNRLKLSDLKLLKERERVKGVIRNKEKIRKRDYRDIPHPFESDTAVEKRKIYRKLFFTKKFL
jgi:hypothetical protein